MYLYRTFLKGKEILGRKLILIVEELNFVAAVQLACKYNFGPKMLNILGRIFHTICLVVHWHPIWKRPDTVTGSSKCCN
jgi:hypothetical protein